MTAKEKSNQSNHIAIKDIAKLMRMSTEAIRYYEKRNILTPYRNTENSYRYYAESDVLKIIGCRHYQDLGFTIGEVIDLMNGYKGGSFENMLEMKHEEIQRRISDSQQSLVRIEESLKASRDYDQIYGKYFIVESLHCLAMFYSQDSVFQKELIPHPFWDAVSQNLNKFIYIAKISPDAVSLEKSDEPLIMSEGFSARYDVAMNLGLSVDGKTCELHPHRCVYTVCKGYPVIGHEQLEPILTWIRRRNLRIVGDILCRARGLSYENNQMCRFYEIHIPIEDD